MKIKIIVVSFFASIMLAGCGSSTPVKPSKIYNKKDYMALTYCMGLSYSARRIAGYKLKGTSIADVKKTISKDSTKKNRELATKLIERVYKEEVKSLWDYSISFFKGCSHNVAKLYEPHTKYATYCLMNSYIGDTAYSFKVKEHNKEKAYQFFEKFKGKTPKAIIDNVYEKAENRRSARLKPWQACMLVRVSND